MIQPPPGGQFSAAVDTAALVIPPGMTGRTITEEASAMSESTLKTHPGMKTLGVKLPDALHAQLALVAQLNDLSLNDAVLKAVNEYVVRITSAPDFAERAAAVVAEIEREAATRRGAIQALFGTTVSEAGADALASETKGSAKRKGEVGA